MAHKIENSELGRASVEEFAQQQKYNVVLVADNVRSANNVGAFFRTADAFAIDQLVLCGITATPPSKEIHKTALGAEQTVRWSYSGSTIEAVERLKEEGYTIIAIEQVEGSVMLDTFKVESGKRYALVVGNEVEGVSQEVVDMCDQFIEIPQEGTKHSLNVSVAAGVVLWHIFSQLRG